MATVEMRIILGLAEFNVQVNMLVYHVRYIVVFCVTTGFLVVARSFTKFLKVSRSVFCVTKDCCVFASFVPSLCLLCNS